MSRTRLSEEIHQESIEDRRATELEEHGIIELRDGLNMATIKKKFPWVLKADISNAILGTEQRRNSRLVWYDGVWKSGGWKAGLWKGGVWKDGHWKRGTWENGTWHDGVFRNGNIRKMDWKYGTMYNSCASDINWHDGSAHDCNLSGNWDAGDFTGGTFLGNWKKGTWKDGTFLGGEWKSGCWRGGNWKDGTWKSGTWEKGNWDFGTWHNGDFERGTWKDGTWHGGRWYEGSWEQGIWKGEGRRPKHMTRRSRLTEKVANNYGLVMELERMSENASEQLEKDMYRSLANEVSQSKSKTMHNVPRVFIEYHQRGTDESNLALLYEQAKKIYEENGVPLIWDNFKELQMGKQGPARKNY